MKVDVKLLKSLLGRTLAVLPLAGFFSSCELVREDLDPCPSPVLELRFVYDYNMEFANAFHSQVHCLSAWFFDSEGRLVTVEKVTDRDLLADEGWRMHPDLPDGTYHVVAYGGMECDQASFFRTVDLSEGSHFSSLHVRLDDSCLTVEDRRRLHNHFYGTADFTVDSAEDTYATVAMMRNTNSIQVALQHLNGSPVDCNDFIFEIIDDNNDFDHANNLLMTGEVTYGPWNKGNRSTGVSGEGEDAHEWYAALAQFTVSRLVKRTAQNGKTVPTTLVVRRAKDGGTVFSIPLVNYMLMFKHDNTGAGLDSMGDQEYLDRENTWNFVFFLDEKDMWIDTRFIVNDWEVRMNSADM